MDTGSIKNYIPEEKISNDLIVGDTNVFKLKTRKNPQVGSAEAAAKRLANSSEERIGPERKYERKLNPVDQFINHYNILISLTFDCLKVAVFAFLFLFMYTRAQAATLTLEEQRLRSKSPWNFMNDVTVDTNAQPVTSVDNSSGATYTSGIRYKLDTKTMVWGFGRLSKRFDGEERLDLLDTIIRLERALDFKPLGMASRGRVDVTLPTNEFVHEQTSFVGALGAQLRFTKTLPYGVFMTWANTARWNFHEFRVSELAIPNIQAIASTDFNFSYALGSKIQAFLGLGWSLAKTYKNIVTDNYQIGVGGTYVLNDKWNTAFGFSTAGSPYSADGQNSNINLFDERDTIYYLSLTHFM